jgi:hypothetical protein
MIAKSASRLGTYFFRKWGRGGGGPGASPEVPDPPPGPPRRLAARDGKGELCTALTKSSTVLCVVCCIHRVLAFISHFPITNHTLNTE